MKSRLLAGNELPAVSRNSSHFSKEYALVAAFITFISGSFSLIQYDRMRGAGPALTNLFDSILNGSMPAPIQYRFGLAYLAVFLRRYAHLRYEQSIPFIEGISFFGCLILLYVILGSSTSRLSAKRSERQLRLAFFFAATQFPLLWIYPWERPETLPTAFYVSALVYLIVRSNTLPFPFLFLLVALLDCGQALLRSDVPVVMGLALLVTAGLGIPLPQSRGRIVALGMLSCVSGGAIQLYIQQVLYPNTRYPPTTAHFQLISNLNLLHPPLHIPGFAIALLPFFLSVYLTEKFNLGLDPSDKLVIIASLLYLPVWFAVGLIAEVRIFVPFLLLLAPTIAKTWARFMLKDDDSSFTKITA